MAAVGGDLVRTAEWHRVRDFAQQVRASPAALAIQGEAGAGKSTLWRAGLQAAVAAGHRLLRSEPSASETDLSFAGLADLLSGALPLVAEQIPGPQREALEIALLLRPAGDEPPTARAIGLAVLTALRACVSEGPVLVAVDDVQWLDEASLDALAFALRRVTSEPLSLLVAARTEAAADPLTTGAARPGSSGPGTGRTRARPDQAPPGKAPRRRFASVNVDTDGIPRTGTTRAARLEVPLHPSARTKTISAERNHGSAFRNVAVPPLLDARKGGMPAAHPLVMGYGSRTG